MTKTKPETPLGPKARYLAGLCGGANPKVCYTIAEFQKAIKEGKDKDLIIFDKLRAAQPSKQHYCEVCQKDVNEGTICLTCYRKREADIKAEGYAQGKKEGYSDGQKDAFKEAIEFIRIMSLPEAQKALKDAVRKIAAKRAEAQKEGTKE